MKIRPVGAELFHTDGRTDMKKLIVAFRNFCERAQKEMRTSCESVKMHMTPNYRLRPSFW